MSDYDVTFNFDDDRLPKEDVGYTAGDEQEKCANCLFFIPTSSVLHSCEIVRPPVRSFDKCALFQPADEQD